MTTETREQTQEIEQLPPLEPVPQHQPPQVYPGALGRRIMHQSDAWESRRSERHDAEIDPVSLYELTQAVPDFGLAAGDYVLLRHPRTWPFPESIKFHEESIVCAWAGEERGYVPMRWSEYVALVPAPFRSPVAAEFLAGFRRVPFDYSGDITECPPLPDLIRWKDNGDGRFWFRQDAAVGDCAIFYQLQPYGDAPSFVSPGLYVLRGHYEPEDDDMVVRSANGVVMRWADVKRRWRSESGRQVDGILLAAFARVI